MLVTFDLTSRQTARVLAEAAHRSAELSIEPRTWSDGLALVGALAGCDANLLTVELHDHEADRPLHSLIGVFCDVQTVLSGQLYLFATCIVDVADNCTPHRLVLAMPTELQLVNRRKFERRLLAQPAVIHLGAADTPQPPIGELIDISGNGLAARVSRANLEDILFVGDEIRISFELPGQAGYFEMPAIICNKTAQPQDEYMTVGFEFKCDDDPATRDGIQRLRRVVCGEITGTSDPEGME